MSGTMRASNVTSAKDLNSYDVDLNAVTWKDSFGTRFNTDNLHQGYLVVFMEALRDVESRLAVSRTSPLQQIMEQCDIPQEEQDALVDHMKEANDNINDSDTIKDIGTELSASFLQTAGPTYTMGVKLGLGEPSFAEITKGLRVLLSGYGLENLDPSRNGLGLNNMLYVSLLLNYFEHRIAKQETAGQLLLVEEPEAHLHPQLQRILLATLQEKQVQVFITTHSTHITSGVPLVHHVVLTSGGGASTQSIKPSTIAGITAENIADLDRYPKSSSAEAAAIHPSQAELQRIRLLLSIHAQTSLNGLSSIPSLVPSHSLAYNSTEATLSIHCF